VFVCAQDDIVMGMLTVRENIEFSAALRLPSSTTQSQRRDKVNEVIADLGLSACANTRVRLSTAYIIIIRQFIRCRNMSESLQGRRETNVQECGVFGGFKSYLIFLVTYDDITFSVVVLLTHKIICRIMLLAFPV